HELGHLVPEQRDQDVVLGLEVQVDGAGGDARLARDVGHARVVIALPREDADGGLDDVLGLVWITHTGWLNRRSFYARSHAPSIRLVIFRRGRAATRRRRGGERSREGTGR